MPRPTVHVIDAAHCCADIATITVGRPPQDMVVDAATHTLYVANQAFDDEPGSLSVVDLRHCTATTSAAAAPSRRGWRPASDR